MAPARGMYSSSIHPSLFNPIQFNGFRSDERTPHTHPHPPKLLILLDTTTTMDDSVPSKAITNNEDFATSMVKACAEIVSELISATDANKDINLNALRSRVARKNKLTSQPRLVDIIAAIPEQYKPILLPKIKARPVRTASGVS